MIRFVTINTRAAGRNPASEKPPRSLRSPFARHPAGRAAFSGRCSYTGCMSAMHEETCPGNWSGDGHSRAGSADPAGIPGAGYDRARTRAVCTRGGPWAGTAGHACRRDAGGERSRTQDPDSGVQLHKASPGRPRVIRAACLSGPRWCRAGRQRERERRDHRRSAAAAYAPGRRTTGTGVLDRRLLRRVQPCCGVCLGDRT